MTTELTQQTIEQDGFIIDAETGEVLGLAKAEFQVTDEKSADWVLEKIMDAEVAIARNDIKRRAILDNIDTQDFEQRRRIEFLKWKFGPQLESFAAKQLENAKTKTWKGTFGKLSFRSTKGGLRVVDAATALETADNKGWDNAIKATYSFQISKLTDEQKEDAVNLPGFEVKPDETSFKIETGVQS